MNRHDPHPSSGSINNSQTLLCTRTFAYLLILTILQDAQNYLHLRVEETVLREVNHLPRVTHLVSGGTNSKPGPSDARMQTLPTIKCQPSWSEGWGGFPWLYTFPPHFTASVPKISVPRIRILLEGPRGGQKNWEHWLPFVLSLKVTFTCLPRHN